MDERRSERRYRLREPVYGTVFPGNCTARLYDCSPSGLGVLYKACDPPPDTIDEIYLLVQGYVHQLSVTDFSLVHDTPVSTPKKQSSSFRKAGIRLNDPTCADIYPMLRLFALEPWPSFSPFSTAERDQTLTMFKQFMDHLDTTRT